MKGFIATFETAIALALAIEHMKTKKLIFTLLSFLAFSLCAVAQTVSNIPGIDLTGPPTHPMIKNHSGKAVLWLSFKRSIAQDADPREGGQWFIGQAGGLPDGASAELQRYNSKTNVVISAAITAAIFADGEFRGKGFDPIRNDVEVTFRFLREEWQWAQAGEWDKLQARADEVDLGIIPQMTAKKFLQARGNDAAMAALAHYGLLPASTWTGGLLNRLRTLPGIQAIAEWFSPTVSTCVKTGPFLHALSARRNSFPCTTASRLSREGFLHAGIEHRASGPSADA